MKSPRYYADKAEQQLQESRSMGSVEAAAIVVERAKIYAELARVAAMPGANQGV